MNKFEFEKDIAKAKTIDKSVYLDTEIFEAAKEKIFTLGWQFIGHEDQVHNVGDIYPFSLLDGYFSEPLMLVKDEKGKINCMSNVCTHRGNMIAYKPCNHKHLRCPYHARIFDLDGKFKSMPEFKEVENFPTQEDDLHNLPVYKWSKLLFTSLHPKMDPEKYLGEMMERVKWMPLDLMKYRADLSKDYHVKSNWALYCENYLEGFHIPFVHAGLNAVLDFSQYKTELFNYASLQIGIAKKGDIHFDIPIDAQDYGMQIAAYYFWVFPNMMFNFYPWGLSLNVVTPTSIDTCKVSFFVYVFDESKLNQGAGNGLDAVEMEDEEVVEHVQIGIRSRFYKHGRYSVKHEKGTHHFHGLLAEFLSK